MSGGAEKALTARQRRFVEEYLVCGDAAEAAVAAGYSPRGAAARGEARDAAFALRCKLGFPDEGREEAFAVIEKVLLKL